MDIAAIIALAEEIVFGAIKAAPIIARDYQVAKPFVDAIVLLAQSGGAPTDADFAAVKAALDANSRVIAQRVADAQAVIDAGEGD